MQEVKIITMMRIYNQMAVIQQNSLEQHKILVVRIIIMCKNSLLQNNYKQKVMIIFVLISHVDIINVTQQVYVMNYKTNMHIVYKINNKLVSIINYKVELCNLQLINFFYFCPRNYNFFLAIEMICCFCFFCFLTVSSLVSSYIC